MVHPTFPTLADKDPWLDPYRGVLERRDHFYRSVLRRFERTGGLLGPISQGHHHFGLTRGAKDGEQGYWYREWAPGARALFLIGDFNGWNRGANPLSRDEFGIWSCFLPDKEYKTRLIHESKYKVHVISEIGAMDRIPAYARRVVQEHESREYVARLWSPEQGHVFQNAAPKMPKGEGLKIYEAHVGIAQEEGKVSTFRQFRDYTLPRIARLGYNAVQLMAIQEHPYYGSFGYHVSNFFAVASRFGTPDELKELVDAAHGLGLLVFQDIVHSHSVKNTHEGLALFDGTQHQYFHSGGRGHHPAWDSLLFDYSKYEVQRFLLSNVRFFLEEYQFDGFRFDGVTSMVYHDHGLGAGFSGLPDYFSGNVDDDAIVYLRMANEVAHAVRPGAITIAEDVSGMPGMARTVADGGIGFDYRLSMGVPDFWFQTVRTKKDEDWSPGDMYRMLLNRRRDEGHVSYVESHDQALVGDKTLSFWLMDAEMYWNMAKDKQSLTVDRGVALHKMIRLITFAIGGEAYLNFIGNEFGHPEWIDFPREGNGFSHHYARRQWSLADNPSLRYQGLQSFDRAMVGLDKHYQLLTDSGIYELLDHEDTKQLVVQRGALLFVFNFHWQESYVDLRIPVPENETYQLILSTDEACFGGFDRVEAGTKYSVQDQPMYGREQSIQIYLPSRSALVLSPARLSENNVAYRAYLAD